MWNMNLISEDWTLYFKPQLNSLTSLSLSLSISLSHSLTLSFICITNDIIHSFDVCVYQWG